MTKDDLAKIIADAVGNPTSGHVADAIPTMATALDEAINGKGTKGAEKRVVEVDEKR